MKWLSGLSIVTLVIAAVALIVGSLGYAEATDNKNKIDETPNSGTTSKPLNDVVTNSLEIVGDNLVDDPDKEYGLTISRYDTLEDGAGIRMTNGRGTRDTPEQTLAGDRLGGIYTNGTREGTGVDIKNQGVIFSMAEKDFTDAGCPTSLVFGTTGNTNVGYTRRAKLTSAGDFMPYDASDRAQDIGSNTNRWDKVYASRLLMAYEFGSDPGEELAPYALNAYSYVGDPTGASEPTAIRLGVLRGEDNAPAPMKSGDVLSGIYSVGAYAVTGGTPTYTNNNQGCIRFVAEGDFTAENATPVGIDFGVCKAGSTSFTVTTRINSEGNLVPAASSSASLGNANVLWSVVYAADNTINTSDERFKNSVEDVAEPGRNFIDRLDLGWWRWNDESGNSQRKKHYGPTAQNVQAALAAELGDDAGDTYMLDEDHEDHLKLSYTDLSMAGLRAVQELSAEVHRLRAEVELLKQ